MSETQPVLSEILPQGSELMDPEAGFMAVGLARKLAAFATAGALGGLGLGIFSRLDIGEVGDRDKTVANVKTLDIVETQLVCSAQGLFDVSGSTGGTVMQVNGHKIPSTGHETTIKDGKIIITICANEADAKPPVVIKEYDKGKPSQNVVVTVYPERLVATTHYTNDTLIVDSDPVGSRYMGGQLNNSSAALELTCDVFSFGQAKKQCKEWFNVFNGWNDERKAELRAALRVKLAEVVRTDCLPVEWTSVQNAINDSYVDQAVRQGFPPETVRVEFVDENGKPTLKAPALARDPDQELVDKSKIKKGDYVDLTFGGIHCTPLKDPKPSKYANKYPTGIPTLPKVTEPKHNLNGAKQ